jgi:hypothetical protein
MIQISRFLIYYGSISSIMHKQITVGVFFMIALTAIGTIEQAVQSQLQKGTDQVGGDRVSRPAIIATSGETVYVVWGSDDPATNTTEVMFRVSGDGGQTYEDKINLSNSTGSNSTDFDVEATDDNVIVSWWETNSTSSEPVLRFSTDNGGTFGPILRLTSNGTIGG